jgi:RNA polymerase sigma-70 factor (sigma-E family)
VLFEDYVRSRAPTLARTAVALTGDPGLAEDLVQEVLLKVHQRWHHISELAERDAYVRRMLVNEHLSWRRKWGRVVPVAEPASGEFPDHAAASVDREVLRAEIARLPRRQQVVLVLRYQAGLPDSQIAETLGCRVGTVRSLASRALATLRTRRGLWATSDLVPVPAIPDHEGRAT